MSNLLPSPVVAVHVERKIFGAWAEMPDTSLRMVSNILKLPKQTWTPQFV
jgi:hypothetical protein